MHFKQFQPKVISQGSPGSAQTKPGNECSSRFPLGFIRQPSSGIGAPALMSVGGFPFYRKVNRVIPHYGVEFEAPSPGCFGAEQWPGPRGLGGQEVEAWVLWSPPDSP